MDWSVGCRASRRLLSAGVEEKSKSVEALEAELILWSSIKASKLMTLKLCLRDTPLSKICSTESNNAHTLTNI